MANEENLNRYMTLIERYKEQINSLQEQSSYLQSAINEYNKAKITVQKLGETEKNTEVLLPIGGGTYVNAKAADPSKLLVDIGGGIVTERNTDKAVEKIDSRIDEIKERREQISSTIDQLQEEADEISTKARELMSQER